VGASGVGYVVVVLGMALALPGWLVLLVFLLLAVRMLLQPAARASRVVETCELLGSTKLMGDEELDRLLDLHEDVDGGGFSSEGRDAVFTKLFSRMDPGYVLNSQDRKCLHALLDLDSDGRAARDLFRRSLKLWYPPLRGKTALIIVDLQNDFVTGSLKVGEGEVAIANTNELRKAFKFDLIAHTRDWHPADHCSFWDNHVGAVMYSEKDLTLPDGTVTSQVMWPRHCVQHSEGSQFHPKLHIEDSDVVVSKGLRTEVDSYSGFFDNCKGSETMMRRIMFESGVTQVYVVGLALDFCVGWTSQDAASCGFESYLVSDCARAVHPEPNHEKLVADFAAKGVTVVHSSQVPLQRNFTGETAMKLARKLGLWRDELLAASRSQAQTPDGGPAKEHDRYNKDDCSDV